jgi:hypothetical protein
MSANIDFITNGQTQGDVARAFSHKLDIYAKRPYIGEDGLAYKTVFKGGDAKDIENYSRELVTNATLRKDEWKHLDEAIVPVAESRLNGVADLISNGLVYNLGNALGTTVLTSETVSNALKATLSMDAKRRAENDRVEFSTVHLPIPIIHVDYEINERVLASSRSLGNPLDTTMAERAARVVAEQLEAMLFTDTDYGFGGGKIYSYLNYPHRNTMQLKNASWTNGSTTAEHIVADVLKMKQASIAKHFYGPWVLYIPTGYETLMDQDYDTTRGNTLRNRILAIAGIKDVKVVDTLIANNVIFAQMTSDVVRLVRGLPIQNVQWESEGGMVNNFKVMTIQVPQIRSDYNESTGIVHASASAE